MKIVGTTDKGFLAQIDLEELGIIMGFGKYPLYGDTKDAFKQAVGLDERHNIKTGTVINVTTGFNYLQTLKEKQAKAKSCATLLRELAEMITTALPEIVIVESDKEIVPAIREAE